jgi:hypothetical protein
MLAALLQLFALCFCTLDSRERRRKKKGKMHQQV